MNVNKPEEPQQEALKEQQASAYIGMSVPYLRTDRMNGHREGRTPGPPFLKIGRTVRYLRTDLDAWLQAHRVDREDTSTEEA
jgi:predicted DNA-binding transcriptional regulator AlpA